ncbi:hypothetical protein [Glaciecola sp. SC05]|uniref:hypothetical protein n=1 Tax=Glaciecola sp. SC05 TaxID=1987355 RepID=UPI003526F0C2
MKNILKSAIVALSLSISLMSNASLVSCDDADASSTSTRDDGFFMTVCYGNEGSDFIIQGAGPSGVAQVLYNNTYGGSGGTFTSVFEDDFINQHFGLALPPTYVVLVNGFEDDGTFFLQGSVKSNFEIIGFLVGRNGVTDTFMGGSLDTVFENSVTLDIVDRVIVQASSPGVIGLMLIACAFLFNRTRR